MNDRLLIELLDAYTNELLREGEDKAEEILRASPQYRETLAPLAKLVKELGKTLVPISPSPAFRRKLRTQLESYTPLPRRELLKGWVAEHRRELAMGAALVGSAFSLAGVVAYLIRTYAHKQARKMAA